MESNEIEYRLWAFSSFAFCVAALFCDFKFEPFFRGFKSVSAVV
jgi:hypothetical protein